MRRARFAAGGWCLSRYSFPSSDRSYFDSKDELLGVDSIISIFVVSSSCKELWSLEASISFKKANSAWLRGTGTTRNDARTSRLCAERKLYTFDRQNSKNRSGFANTSSGRLPACTADTNHL